MSCRKGPYLSPHTTLETTSEREDRISFIAWHWTLTEHRSAAPRPTENRERYDHSCYTETVLDKDSPLGHTSNKNPPGKKKHELARVALLSLLLLPLLRTQQTRKKDSNSGAGYGKAVGSPRLTLQWLRRVISISSHAVPVHTHVNNTPLALALPWLPKLQLSESMLTPVLQSVTTCRQGLQVGYSSQFQVLPGHP